jgi:1-acyl-sn-glycerol-3-phosphate acyltransferase
MSDTSHAGENAPRGTFSIEAAADHEAIAAQTLAIVQKLATELHGKQGRPVRAQLESNLDRDLGFDSLGRAELILRLDRAFRVRLPDRLINDAVTTRDLVEAIGTSASVTHANCATSDRAGADLQAISEPSTATTLVEVLSYHAKAHHDRPHVGLWLGDRIGEELSYGRLHHDALCVARGLEEAGAEPGECIAIMLPTGLGFFRTFFGILYAGCIPVPIYPPFRRAQVEDHLRRQAGILENAEVVLLVTESEIRQVGMLLMGLVPTMRDVLTDLSLMDNEPTDRQKPAEPGDIALIQYTSGSTGDPKGVVLTHANLLANIRAMGAALDATSKDVFVSWLPLYHDMGLIGAWLGSLYFGARAVVMSPLTFLADPTRWLRAIAREGGTLSAAPNFAFELCLKNIRDEDMEGIDLSRLRAVVNGAEPVSPITIRNFTTQFSRFGFRSEALAPVYGLAECSVGLAFPPLGRRPPIDRVERAALTDRGRAIPTRDDDATSMEFVACGRPLANHQIRIVDDLGIEVPERQQGRLQFKGPSATRGYFRDKAKTEALFDGDWLESGDLAYIAEGDVYLTGRVKDIIIRAGRNIYPHEIEDAIGRLDGVRKGCVAAFASPDPHTSTERLIVLAETRLNDAAARTSLMEMIRDVTLQTIDLPPDQIVLAAPHAVPKTSSGKIRRSAAKALFEADALGATPQDLRWQLVRLHLSGISNRWHRTLAKTSALAYAAYWWIVLSLIAAVVWPAVVALPRRSWRHAVIRRATRLWFALTRIDLRIEGDAASLPKHVVIVANHSSFLDVSVLSAAIPGELTFVAKQEFSETFWEGTFLRRLGTIFVKRVDRAAGLEGRDELINAVKHGERLVVFPEGTLLRRPGILSFRLGAFAAAAATSAAVVPVAIRGTRDVLRGEQWFPRRGAIAVDVGAPIAAFGTGFEAELMLRDTARAWILEHVPEPDLATDTVDLAAMGQR